MDYALTFLNVGFDLWPPSLLGCVLKLLLAARLVNADLLELIGPVLYHFLEQYQSFCSLDLLRSLRVDAEVLLVGYLLVNVFQRLKAVWKQVEIRLGYLFSRLMEQPVNFSVLQFADFVGGVFHLVADRDGAVDGLVLRVLVEFEPIDFSLPVNANNIGPLRAGRDASLDQDLNLQVGLLDPLPKAASQIEKICDGRTEQVIPLGLQHHMISDNDSQLGLRQRLEHTGSDFIEVFVHA